MLSSRQTALLVLLVLENYQGESGRGLSRFRLSRKSFRRISGRKNLRDSFIEDVRADLVELGWALIEIEDHFALLRLDRIDTWQRLATARIADTIKSAHRGEYDFNGIEARLAQPTSDDAATDD